MPNPGHKKSPLSPRKHSAIAWLIIALAFFVGARYVISDPRSSEEMRIVIPFAPDIPVFSCPFYSLTRLPCPVCGITRSSALVVRGDVVGSFEAHPLGPLLALGMALLIPVSVWMLFSKEREDAKTRIVSTSAVSRWIFWIVVALFTIAWIINLGRHLGLIGW